MYGLDLFSGIGGISIALEPWVRPIVYCERDRYAQGVLLSRMADGTLQRAPIWDDVRTLHQHMFPRVDIIYGGFPCQDISTAGRGEGLGGERSGLFFEIIRLTRECGPAFVFLENVPAIRTRGLNEVARAFTDIGYDCRWTVVSASEIGAPHIRKRWFLLAHNNGSIIWNKQQRPPSRRFGVQTKGETFPPFDGTPRPVADAGRAGFPGPWECGGISQTESKGPSTIIERGGCSSDDVANADCVRQPQSAGNEQTLGLGPFISCENVADTESERGSEGRLPFRTTPTEPVAHDDSEYFGKLIPWSIEPSVGRVANGIPHRVDRIKGLGNAVVPQQAQVAFQRLLGADV